jgi:hypothetical protein
MKPAAEAPGGEESPGVFVHSHPNLERESVRESERVCDR